MLTLTTLSQRSILVLSRTYGPLMSYLQSSYARSLKKKSRIARKPLISHFSIRSWRRNYKWRCRVGIPNRAWKTLLSPIEQCCVATVVDGSLKTAKTLQFSKCYLPSIRSIYKLGSNPTLYFHTRISTMIFRVSWSTPYFSEAFQLVDTGPWGSSTQLSSRSFRGKSVSTTLRGPKFVRSL